MGQAPDSAGRSNDAEGASGSAINLGSYDAIAHEWDTARTSLSTTERRFLDAVLDGLAAPARILDLGCGTGRPIAEYVLSRGHHVTGVDQSEALLGIARARLPRGEWVHARMEDSSVDVYREASFHGAIVWDSLFHVERERHAAILAKVHRALVPGGRVTLTAGGSVASPFTDSMFEREFFYDSYPPEELAALLGELGFEIVLNEFINLPTSGRDKGRIAIVARRR
jgi:cyclopropane fatty-acyl-phospholipid synthase-like methyltransferase